MRTGKNGQEMWHIYSYRFNIGLFKVGWKESRAELERDSYQLGISAIGKKLEDGTSNFRYRCPNFRRVRSDYIKNNYRFKCLAYRSIKLTTRVGETPLSDED